MTGKLRIALATLTVAGLAVGGATAQTLSQGLGAFEYANSCASCHGVSGEGDGPMVGYLTTRPTDLTVLRRENGGVFPVSAVFDTINGTDGVGAHGTSDMPVWGSAFRMRAEADSGFPPEAAQGYAQARILALIEHLASLQKD